MKMEWGGELGSITEGAAGRAVLQAGVLAGFYGGMGLRALSNSLRCAAARRGATAKGHSCWGIGGLHGVGATQGCRGHRWRGGALGSVVRQGP